MENNEKQLGKWEIKLENWRWHRWHGASGDGQHRWKESQCWVVLKRMEPVMGGREGLTVGWVVEKTEKAWDDKERQCIESRDRECANKCKIFFHYFKCKIKYFTQIYLDSFNFLKIFYFWLNILLQTNIIKCENIFLKIFYIKINRALITMGL